MSKSNMKSTSKNRSGFFFPWYTELGYFWAFMNSIYNLKETFYTPIHWILSQRSLEKYMGNKLKVRNVSREELLTKVCCYRLNGPRENEKPPPTPLRWTTHGTESPSARADRKIRSSSAVEGNHSRSEGRGHQRRRRLHPWRRRRREAGTEERGRKMRKEEKPQGGVELSQIESLIL